MSASIRSRTTSGSYSNAPLVMTATGLSVRRRISRSRVPRSAYRVGSPSPTTVTTSKPPPGSLSAASQRSSSPVIFSTG